MGRRRQWGSSSVVVGFQLMTMMILLGGECGASSSSTTSHKISKHNNEDYTYPPVQLYIVDEDHVMVDNGLVNVTFSIPGGMVTGIEYNGIDNLLESENDEDSRGYWDVVWTRPGQQGQPPGGIFDKMEGSNYEVIVNDEDQVELSFTRTWDDFSSNDTNALPLNLDKRYIILRGSIGFYSYAIFERSEGWPALNLYQGRIVFKLRESLFEYMAISDEKQRIMPTAEDRLEGKVLDYKEAVLLENPSNPFLKGEVDDKYQYSSDNKDNRIHGWISPDPPTGFWMVTPSNEFKTAGPVKQDLTSHTGPITLSMFFSTHYAGESLGIKFEDGEAWKKVFGPVFIYLNSVSPDDDPLLLWADAKEQMLIETEEWPYDFPFSEDYHGSDLRGTITGRLLVSGSYINESLINADSAFVGLAPPGGEAGSWQRENKGYQFWTETDSEGYFLIPNILSGNYSLNAWVPGFVGDYRYEAYLSINPGSKVRLGTIVYEPPRRGPTLWEIGIPDRTAAEFYIPPPNPTLMNKLYVDNPERFRQYGLWERYTELYPEQDLVYMVGFDDYPQDWFFAHVNRDIGNKTYVPTTWQIVFGLDSLDPGNYTLQLALASANEAELQVRINDPDTETPHFTTGVIGKDNAIARHGIHGLYWLFSVNVSSSQLEIGGNTIYLTQSRGLSPWKGIMYDYIRLEGPFERSD